MMNNRVFIIEQEKEIEKLKEIIEQKDLKIMELNIKLARTEGLLDKYKNFIKITMGREL